jgi:hypothetical protein
MIDRFKKTVTALPAAILLMACFTSMAFAGHSRHELAIDLQLENHKIIGEDRISIEGPAEPIVTLRLSEHALIKSVSVNDLTPKYSFRSGKLVIETGANPKDQPVVLTVSYEAVFNDPLPSDSTGFDNPGFGVAGTITEKGAFLLSDSGWYPQVRDDRSNFELKVAAPRGVYAVTAGELVKHEDDAEKSISIWKVGETGQGLALSAGRYVIHSRTTGRVPIFTYFFAETDSLSETYLNAAASHIDFYEALHGPYPFPKFAIVENFFPTGYGFPSYTLLGGSVLRLPFIPLTSLRHEIAHCWWGNGVLVDYDSGNWCEGLTTYVADYVSQENISAADGKLYRQQILRDYATLAGSGEDFPLREFTSRTSPATKAVGYGKAAFIFHMIRQKLGDESFWKSLRQIFKDRLFMKTSWDDLRDVFVKTGGWDEHEARKYFDQWLTRSGAPSLKLQSVRSVKKANGRGISGSLMQSSPLYDLDLNMRLVTSAGQPLDNKIHVQSGSVPFLLPSDQVPERLIVDPDCNVFRLLHHNEIPATVNSIKGSKVLAAVLSDGSSQMEKETLSLLLSGLNHSDTIILRESEVDLKRMKNRDFLFFGRPRSPQFKVLLASMPSGSIPGEGNLAPKDFQGADCAFTVFSNPNRQGGITALFTAIPAAEDESVTAAARKITHYGKYSYLTFSRGINQQKGVWESSNSPLFFDFNRNR